MRIVVGSDHAGLVLKDHLAVRLRAQGHEVEDVGTNSSASCDYPDLANAVGSALTSGRVDFGILVCGTGQGMAMTANRISGIRAAVLSDTFSARSTRAHNDANVLCLGQRVVGSGLAEDIVDAFLNTPFEGGRHAGRVAKMMANDVEKA
ncbi:MAG: ribose 5-phosphate isomerase B [Pseudomonadota bacterium]|nr:ribose 5-phosphate isomerase B [Pseudomonadota bacterium]